MKPNEKIKLIRNVYNLKQDEFAESIGTSRPNLSKLENGESSVTKTMALCISAIYEIDIDWLLSESDESIKFTGIPNIPNYILECYKQLNPHRQKLARMCLKFLLDTQSNNTFSMNE